MKVLEAKMVVLGVQGVGKTSLIIRHTSNLYSKNVSPTIGASFFSCTLVEDDYKIRLQIWDTAGQERFRAMAPMYYRNANSSFLVFDITSYESYMGMKTWVEELRQKIDGFVHICILGNKSDLETTREVKTEEAQEYADMIGADYVETSAFSNDEMKNGGIVWAKYDVINLPNYRFYQMDADQQRFCVEKAFSCIARGVIKIFENGNSNIKVVDYGGNGTHQENTPSSTLTPTSESTLTLTCTSATEKEDDHGLCC